MLPTLKVYTTFALTFADIKSSNQNEASALERDQRFGDLDQAVRDFVSAYALGQDTLKALIQNGFQDTHSRISAAKEHLTRQIEEQHQETRRHIDRTQQRYDVKLVDKAVRQQLLKSLDDPERNRRRNQIERSHSKTFRWVLYYSRDEDSDHETVSEASSVPWSKDPFGSRDVPWDNFVQWLQCKDPLYWISGKAGSGKSTLMKYLSEDRKTKAYLKTGMDDAVVYSYFIWNSGSTTQCSLRSLLMSLVRQILERKEQLFQMIVESRAEITRIKYSDEWSISELEEILLQLLLWHPTDVCIFIDGLDEIDQKDRTLLVGFLDRIVVFSGPFLVKICVSSRPENLFRRRLESYPRLKLEDLTRYDIVEFTRDFLTKKCSFDMNADEEKKLVDEVTHKAQGVFLWVSLALKSLERGIANRDTPFERMRRLRSLPSELEDLYRDMFKRLGDDQTLYEQDAALYFSTVIAIGELSNKSERIPHMINAFHFMLITDAELRNELLLVESPPPLFKIQARLLDMEGRIQSHCAGLLEVTKGRYFRKHMSPWTAQRVDFLHRSGRDFIINLKGEILYKADHVHQEIYMSLLQSLALEEIYVETI